MEGKRLFNNEKILVALMPGKFSSIEESISENTHLLLNGTRDVFQSN